MMKRLVLGLLAASALVYSVAGQAANTAKGGVYIDGSIGYGKVNEVGEYYSYDLKNENTGFAWNANLGYKFTPNWAVEIGYYGLPNEKFKFYGDTIFEGKSNYVFALVGKGILPLGDRANVFAKLGIANAHHERVANSGYTVSGAGSHNGAVALLGAGMGFMVVKNLDIIAQAAITSKNNDQVIPQMYLGTVGLSYTFDL